MHNLYEQFRRLVPDSPLQAGTVVAVGSGMVTVALPGGGLIKARGNRTRAADLMGISRRTLHRKLAQWPDLDVKEG